MTDLEMTLLCAAAMQIELRPRVGARSFPTYRDSDIMQTVDDCRCYDPLHDDAQCLALAKKFPDLFSMAVQEWAWQISKGNPDYSLNYDFCGRVAKMHLAKKGTP